MSDRAADERVTRTLAFLRAFATMSGKQFDLPKQEFKALLNDDEGIGDKMRQLCLEIPTAITVCKCAGGDLVFQVASYSRLASVEEAGTGLFSTLEALDGKQSSRLQDALSRELPELIETLETLKILAAALDCLRQ
jgi:hypothetical protein